MKIEIEYNGAFAMCNIELMDEPGKMVNFNDADIRRMAQSDAGRSASVGLG